MRNVRLLPVVVLGAFITACATVSDPQTDYYHPFRAGSIALQVQPGIYKIEAKSKPSYIAFSESAREIWAMRAEDACAEKSYSELSVTESSYEVRSSSTDSAMAALLFGPALAEPGGAALSRLPQHKVGVRKGYVVCGKANITAENAIQLIREKGWPLK